jgi:hypothetical protein
LIKQKRFAFLAGLLDGDGSISIRDNYNGSGYQLTMSIYSTSRQLMKWLVLTFGGTFRKIPTKGNRKQKYQWYTGAKKLIAGVLPYATLKRRAVSLAIDFLDLGNERCPERRNHYMREIQEANQDYVRVKNIPCTGMILPTKLDFAYLAGLFDAEGSFSIYSHKDRGNGKYTSVIRISNTDQRIFNWVADHFTGYMVVNDRRENKDEGVWFLSGKHRESVLLAILPYLIIKKERASIVLEWIRHCTEWSEFYKDKVVAKMKRLNLRGVSPETIRQAQ